MSTPPRHPPHSRLLQHPLPPFTAETALQKTKAAEAAWNTMDPVKVAGAYSPDTVWRNRDEVFAGDFFPPLQRESPHSAGLIVPLPSICGLNSATASNNAGVILPLVLYIVPAE